jgi:hypothetical protein
MEASNTAFRTPALVGINPLRAGYIALLRIASVETAREFWRAFPLTLDGRDLSEAELYQHVWNDKSQIPVDYFSRVFANLDRFLHRSNLDVSRLADEIRAEIRRGTYVGAKRLLELTRTLVPDLIVSMDPHFELTRGIAAITRVDFPQALVEFVRASSSGGEHLAFAGFAPDPSFAEPALWENNLYTNGALRFFPTAFGLPPFEDVWHVAECQPVDWVLLDEERSLTSGVLRVNGRRIGKQLRFSEFLSRIGAPPLPFTFPDRDVIEVEDDYVCPVRGRTVLHAGNAYGAPFYVARFRWRPVQLDASQFAGRVVEEISEAAFQPSDEDLVRHRALLALAQRRAQVSYHAERDAVSIDGATVLTGTPARILRTVLRQWTQDSTHIFEHRALKHDRAIAADPKRSGFELRLRRITEKLNPQGILMIEKVSKGKFRLRATLPVDYREEP